jgi:tetratricopeptide (TPR) repeat protein
MSESSLPLGALKLQSLIGRGGVGEVWQAVDALGRLPVAVKVLTHARYREPEVLDALQAELCRAARVDHPGVVQLFGWGFVDAGLAQATQGKLPDGAPYVAMELVTAGSLQTYAARLGWDELRGLLLGVLDALAHLHAKGMLHRNIKPANVLWGAPRDARPGPKLADLGLASPLDLARAPARARVAGAPAYLAPEQFNGRWRALGPETDLYSLGVVAWECVTGVLPFRGSSVYGIRQGHLKGALPALRPRLAVPTGMGDWLGRILEKERGARFASAAEAADALLALGPPVGDEELASLELHSAEGEGWARAPAWWLNDAPSFVCLSPRPAAGELWVSDDVLRSAEEAVDAVTRARGSVAPLRSAAIEASNLRPVSLFGRDAERRALWTELEQALVDGRPRVVVLHGPAGVGLSRLGRWVGERAQELGAAGAVSGVADPAQGLVSLLGAWSQAHGAGLEDAEALLGAALARDGGEQDPTLAAALAGWITPGAPPRAAPRTAEGAPVALLGWLRHRLSAGPQVIWIDDAPRHADAAAFARAALRESGALLLVLTARDDELVGRSPGATALKSLTGKARVSRVRVGPLAPETGRALGRHLLLGVEESRCDPLIVGFVSPGVAMEATRAWVEDGALSAAEPGLAWTAPPPSHAPERLIELTLGRLRAVLEPAEARAAFAVAAALGREVPEALWRAACGLLNVPPSAAMTTRLCRLGLWEDVPGGWRFTSTTALDAASLVAERAGLKAQAHRAVAEALTTSGGSPEGVAFYAERAGDDPTAALLGAAQARRRRGDPRGAVALLEARAKALKARGQTPSPDEQAEAHIERARCLRALGEQAQAKRAGEQALLTAEASVDRRAGAMAELALTAASLGEGAVAARLAAQAMDTLRPLGASEALGDAIRAAASLAADPQRAEILLNEAVEVYDEAACPLSAGDALARLGQLALARGAVDESGARLRRALSRARAVGDMLAEARAQFGLASLAQRAGALPEAERRARRALSRLDLLAEPGAASVRLTLATLKLRRGAIAEAAEDARLAAEALRAQGRDDPAQMADALQAPGLAQRGDWAGLDAICGRLSAALSGPVQADADVVNALKLAARLAESAGRIPVAESLRGLLGAA